MTQQEKQGLILASASPRRHELLSRMGVSFEAIAADIDETKRATETPASYCERMAYEKARKVQMAHPEAWVIGSDTCVVLADTILGKPASRGQAIETIGLLSGNKHQVMTSVCLLSPSDKQAHLSISDVYFAQLSDAQIVAYCDTNEPYDKAGAYGIQGLAGVFVERIDGDYSAIMGLPLQATWTLLQTYSSQSQT